jgi:hypothetical protein
MNILACCSAVRKFLAAVSVVVFAIVAAPGYAQESPGSEPISLVIAYKAKPENRPALRAAMEGPGIAQFERWKKEGAFADYELFFSVLAGPGPTGDMTLILRFAHFTDLAGWTKIERTTAGGLPPEARLLAEPVSSDLADLPWENPPAKGPHTSLYVLFPYVITADAAKYKAYTTYKTVPQLDLWIKEGAITGYRMYMCRAEAGAWSSLLVMDYTGYKGLGSQSTVEPKVRQILSKDPTWKNWLDESLSIRTLYRPMIADKLNSD